MPGPYDKNFEDLIDQATYANITDLDPIAKAQAGYLRDSLGDNIRRRLSAYAVNHGQPGLELYHQILGYRDRSWITNPEANLLKQRAIDKIASLRKEQALTQTITGLQLTDVTGNTADYQHVNAYVTAGTPAGKLAALGTAGFDTAGLREEDAVRLDALVIAKKASLLKEQALTQTITGLQLTDVTGNTADYQHVNAYVTAGTPAGKLAALGTAGFDTAGLREEDAVRLDALVIAKKASLLKEQALTQTITGLQLTDVTGNTADYQHVNAYVTAGTPAGKLAALGTAGFDTAGLREEDAVRLDVLVIAKKASLLKEQALTQTITGLQLTDVTGNTADYQHVNAYVTAGTPAGKLAALGTAGFDTAGLREEDAVRLDVLVIAKKASLLKEQALTQTITGLQLTDVTGNTADYQHVNAYVTAGTPAGKLAALGTAGFDTAGLREEDAVRLDVLVIAKKASLLKEQALTQTITGLQLTDVTGNTADYQHVNAYVTAGTPAGKLAALGTAGFDTAGLREEDAVRLDALVIAKKASLLKEQALTQTIMGLQLTDVTGNTADYQHVNAYVTAGTPAGKLAALGTAGFDTAGLREEDAVRLDALVIAKKASLLKEQALTQTITGLQLTDVTGNTADYQHVNAYVTAGTPAGKLAALGTAGFDTAGLREEDAVRLDVLVIAKKASLLKEQALTQTITGLQLTDVTGNTADYQHVNAYVTAGTPAGKLAALGTAGFDTAGLREEDAVRLDALVIAKRASLLKEQALTQTIMGLQLTDVTGNTADYQHVNAYVTAGTPAGKLAALGTAGFDTAGLREEDAVRLDALVIAKKASLLKEQALTQTITGLQLTDVTGNTADYQHVNAYVTAGTPAGKLAALGTAGFDTAGLREEDAVRLDALVIAKRASLMHAQTITDTINTNLSMGRDEIQNEQIMAILRSIVTAPRGQIRVALNNAKAALGIDPAVDLLDVNVLSQTEAVALQARATQKYSFFLITEAIKKGDQRPLFERLANASGEVEVRGILNANLDRLNLSGVINPTTLSRDDLLEIKRQAGLRHGALSAAQNFADTLIQTGPDRRLEHFTDTLVRDGQLAPLPNPSTVVTGSTGLSTANPLETRYKGVKLEAGDTIHSVANFPKKDRGDPRNPTTATGRLVQDHTGKVTDATETGERAKMTEQEKSQMAIKQAKMLITNMQQCAKKGWFSDDEQTIFITGDNKDHANRVYAALLLMKGDLKFKIESHVEGSDEPKKDGIERQSTADKRFIKDKLKGMSEKALDGIKQETKDFTSSTVKSREQMALMRSGQGVKVTATDALVVDDQLTSSGLKK